MLRGALSLFTGGIFGKFLGIFREGLLAYLYGTSEVAAASRVSQTSVLSPMNLVTSDALSGAFLPQLASLQRQDERAALVLYRAVRNLLVLVGAAFLAAYLIWGEKFLSLLVPNLGESFLELTLAMAIAMACGAPFYLYVNIAGYLAMSKADYAISSVRATGQSVGLIAGILCGYLLDRPALLSWGFTAAYVILAVWAAMRIRRRGYFSPAFVRSSGWREMWNVLRPFLNSAKVLVWMPLFSQCVIVSEKFVAAGLGVGAVAAVDYARIIADTAVLLIAMPIGLASLPTFAVLEESVFRSKLQALVNPLITVSVLCSALLFILSESLVEVLFGRGAFDEQSVITTSAIVQWLSLGMAGLLLSYVFTKVLNARGQNWRAICSVGVTAAVTIVARPFLVEIQGVAGLGTSVSVGGLCGAIAAAAWLGVLRPVGRGAIMLSPCLLIIVIVALRGPVEIWESVGWSATLVVVWAVNIISIRELRESFSGLVSSRRRSQTSGRHRVHN